ncbi:unnamed protein product [Moneuplotes crassus]|uniref:Uncharacterized protein n=2 Tax=Euplotes crassus TaxID=5936 RepID=A0AAD2D4Y4_EUPCR|nr:unnamed protein product [Moneuplotes crassus]
MNRDYDYMFKVVLIGDSNVGKSCLLIRFADDCFTENYITTIGVDFRFRTMTVNKNTVKLQIWDTAGQERYRTITNAYYRGSDGILLVADATNRKSLDNIPDWLSEIEKYTDDEVYKMLIVNKSDLEEKTEISDEDLKKFSKLHGIPYMWTSAKSGINVDDSFLKMTQSLISKRELEDESGLKTKTGKKGTKSTLEGSNLFRNAEKAMNDKETSCCNN